MRFYKPKQTSDMLKTTNYYFAYGMNMPRDRFPHSQWIGAAVLPSHVLEFHTHADVRPHDGAIVRGSLWTIDDRDLHGLDRQEGYPSYYDRKIVDVYRGWRQGGRPVKAITYFMNRGAFGQKNMNHALPYKSYYDTIAQGFMDCGHDPKHLIRALEANERRRLELEARSVPHYLENWALPDDECEW